MQMSASDKDLKREGDAVLLLPPRLRLDIQLDPECLCVIGLKSFDNTAAAARERGWLGGFQRLIVFSLC